MKKTILFLLLGLFLMIGVTLQARSISFVSATEEEGTIPVYLFLSDACPWCRKLKEQGFVTKFKNKYAGEISLKEYEIHSLTGRVKFAAFSKKYKLNGVPALIVDGTVISGYSEDMLERAEEAVEKARKTGKYKKALAKSAKAENSAKVEKSQPMIMSITMDDEELTGVASAKDKERMKAYLQRMQDDNGEMIASMNQMFNAQIANKAMTIANTYEKKIKTLANKSASYEDFKSSATVLETQQQKQIDKLVRDNVKLLRK